MFILYKIKRSAVLCSFAIRTRSRIGSIVRVVTERRVVLVIIGRAIARIAISATVINFS